MGLVLDYKNGIPSLDTGNMHIIQDGKKNQPTNITQLYNQQNKKNNSSGANIPGKQVRKS
jgi:hypothetical protein